MKSTFKQPQIYDELLLLYRTYWEVHKHLPRPFRMTTGEAILQEITGCIKGVILANNVDKNEVAQCALAVQYLGDTRASLVVIRGMLTLGWGMKLIAHGLFMRLTLLLDSAEKQVTRWQKWFMTRSLHGGQNPGAVDKY
ncbi:hypothetical protein [Serratia fonticola]|uniref:hypothetical protein n=1 Tax=Serratia fonticola TaxID=47917 RepID=UPI00192D0051|nr:hypothetical protein [Serratia fonticola]MBL5829434.1 hypothetical protein [Serratia fonticola]